MKIESPSSSYFDVQTHHNVPHWVTSNGMENAKENDAEDNIRCQKVKKIESATNILSNMVAHPFIDLVSLAPLSSCNLRAQAVNTRSDGSGVSSEYHGGTKYHGPPLRPRGRRSESFGTPGSTQPPRTKHDTPAAGFPIREEDRIRGVLSQRVKFSTVHVRIHSVEYAFNLTDKPYPLTMGWNCLCEEIYSVDGYDNVKRKSDRDQLKNLCQPPENENRQPTQEDLRGEHKIRSQKEKQIIRRIPRLERRQRLRFIGYSDAEIDRFERQRLVLQDNVCQQPRHKILI